MSEQLLDLWEEYRAELRAWRRAEFRAQEGAELVSESDVREQVGMAPAPAEPESPIPGDDRIHEVIEGLRLVFGDAVAHAVSDPVHKLRNGLTIQLRSTEAGMKAWKSEAEQMDTNLWATRDLIDGFFPWFEQRYYVRKR